jgi:hypothetical protein
MTAEPGLTSTDQTDYGAATQTPDRSPDGAAALPVTKPYLKVFGPDVGVFEYELPARLVTIGRSPEADIQLPNPRVSRAHATITCEADGFVLQDAGSTAGTVVNGQPTDRHELRHGDTIQIGLYILEFRTHGVLPGAVEAAAQAKLLLRGKYCLLPSIMRLRYRPLSIAPKEVFRTGDTLKIGHGGLLIPTANPPGDSLCLELQLSWPTGAARCYLGEVVGVVEKQGIHWICVKLHTVPKHTHEATVDAGQPGTWVEVVAT